MTGRQMPGQDMRFADIFGNYAYLHNVLDDAWMVFNLMHAIFKLLCPKHYNQN